jgi:cell division protein FtsB
VSYWVTVYRFTWILIVVVCVVGLVCLFLPRYAEYRSLQQRRDDLAEGVRKDVERRKQLLLQQEKFRTDPEYVEQIARDDGMVGPDQSVIKLVTNDLAVATNR